VAKQPGTAASRAGECIRHQQIDLNAIVRLPLPGIVLQLEAV
jgi:hypothetical protein